MAVYPWLNILFKDVNWIIPITVYFIQGYRLEYTHDSVFYSRISIAIYPWLSILFKDINCSVPLTEYFIQGYQLQCTFDRVFYSRILITWYPCYKRSFILNITIIALHREIILCHSLLNIQYQAVYSIAMYGSTFYCSYNLYYINIMR